jgi:hypothetical protein
MKDQRIPFIRKTLDSLIESLEATLRVRRWSGAESVPEPLKLSADRLLDRLGAADRLAASAFRGTPADMTRVEAMLAAMKRLDAAYVAYRSRIEKAPGEKDEAAIALDEAIGEVKAGASSWASF